MKRILEIKSDLKWNYKANFEIGADILTDKVLPRPMQWARIQPPPSSFFSWDKVSTQQSNINWTAIEKNKEK